jgi:hypothetical protein
MTIWSSAEPIQREWRSTAWRTRGPIALRPGQEPVAKQSPIPKLPIFSRVQVATRAVENSAERAATIG